MGKLFHAGMLQPALQPGANGPAGLPAIGGESPAARTGRLREHAEVSSPNITEADWFTVQAEATAGGCYRHTASSAPVP